MTRKRAALAIPFALLLIGFAPPPEQALQEIHEKYEIAPGTHTLLVVNTTSWAQGDVQFALHGNGNALRIRRVRATCLGTDVTFADATPHEATAYFANSPASTSANFEITVENLDDKPASLQLKVEFVNSSNPICGL